MSLRYFHMVFISISAVFAAGFAVWAIRDYRLTGDTTNLIFGVGAAIAVLPILFYAGWFWRKSRRLTDSSLSIAMIVVSTAAMIPNTSLACAVCFTDPDSLMSKGARWGVGFLGIVVVSLLIVIGAIAYRWVRRDSEMVGS